MIPKVVKIALAQIEVYPGYPTENTNKILKWIEIAKKSNVDLVVFPEMAVPGYFIGDIWERTSFINECMNCNALIRDASEGIAVIWGNVASSGRERNEDGRERKYNVAMAAEKGKYLIVRNTFNDPYVIKSLMPDYREFNDNRHFYSYRKLCEERGILSTDESNYGPFILENGLKIGCVLCEDAWDDDYAVHPVDYVAKKSDIILNLSCSPFTSGKNDKRNRVFSRKASEVGKTMAYVNCVGIQDIGKTVYTFDGGSCFYDKNGKCYLMRADEFEECIETFHINLEYNTIGQYRSNRSNADDIGKLFKAVKYGANKFMERHGINKVVIGASGGIDSAMVAAIMSEILPPENILLVNMPSQYNSDTTKDLAHQLADNIGCNYAVTDIEASVQNTNDQICWSNVLNKKCDNMMELSDFMMENVQARDRSSRILAGWAALFGGVFTCNANKTEMTVGYTTMYGDLGGFLAPLADLWKTQVYEMARWFNEHVKNVIPQGSIDIKPSAELKNNQVDPINYEYHDLLLTSWVERWDRATPEDILKWYKEGMGRIEKELGWFNKASIGHLFDHDDVKFIEDLERWWKCYQGLGVAKRIQAPPVLAVSRRAFGFDHREAQIGPTFTEEYKRLKEELTGGHNERIAN